jgi:ribosomal protein S18 acetylase RimI-like enzyme
MKTTTFSKGVSLRPERDDDRPFLQKLYGTTREMELQNVPWTDEQKALFVEMQFSAQTAHYKDAYSDAEFWVIERDAVPVGRLYLHQQPDDLRIVDIALLPEERGSGLGTEILETIMDEASARGSAVSIHVEMFNPALKLYDRLGFRHVADQGVYYLMKWTPE